MLKGINSEKVEEGLTEYPIPRAAEDEILIEKTPSYSLGSGERLLKEAKAMKSKMPDVKLLVNICDPAKRAFSHIKHHATVSNQSIQFLILFNFFSFSNSPIYGYILVN